MIIKDLIFYQSNIFQVEVEIKIRIWILFMLFLFNFEAFKVYVLIKPMQQLV